MGHLNTSNTIPKQVFGVMCILRIFLPDLQHSQINHLATKTKPHEITIHWTYVQHVQPINSDLNLYVFCLVVLTNLKNMNFNGKDCPIYEMENKK